MQPSHPLVVAGRRVASGDNSLAPPGSNNIPQPITSVGTWRWLGTRHCSRHNRKGSAIASLVRATSRQDLFSTVAEGENMDNINSSPAFIGVDSVIVTRHHLYWIKSRCIHLHITTLCPALTDQEQ